MQYSLLDRRPEECFPLLNAKNIGVLTRGSVAQGLLVNKPPKPYLNYSEAPVANATKAVRSISSAPRSQAQTAIQFVFQQPAVVSAVVGMRTRQQLEEAVATVEAPPLSQEEMEILTAAIPVNYYKEHR
jgi:aryl-alcohol dehydrogenase-like predicted oxidoreductase